MNRLLIVFEFPPGDHEWQNRDVADALLSQDPKLQIRFCHGWYARYRAGGRRWGRIANGLWVHLRALLQIVFGRSDAVLVRSTPPLIQITVALACRLRGIPYMIWLMDAHPEIEYAMWSSRPGLGCLLSLLVKLNAACLRGAQVVIVLDGSMRQRLVPTLPDDRVVVCPTWGRAAPVI